MRVLMTSAGALAASIGSASADELLDRLAAASVPDEAPAKCSVTMTSINTENGERQERVYRFDAATEETTLIGPPEAVAAEAEAKAEAAKPEKKKKKEEKDGETVSFGMTPYAVAAAVGTLDYELVGRSGGLSTYKAAPLPKGTFEPSGRDMSKRSAAILTVRDGEVPAVERFAYELQKEVRIPMIARVRTLRQETRYAEVEGAMRPVGMAMVFDADVMGSEQQGEFEMALSDYDCPVSAAD